MMLSQKKSIMFIAGFLEETGYFYRNFSLVISNFLTRLLQQLLKVFVKMCHRYVHIVLNYKLLHFLVNHSSGGDIPSRIKRN